MTRNIKKAISVLLVLVMLLSILQGCSRNNSESKVVDENTTIEETVPATLSAATTDEMQTPENAEIDDTVKSFDNLNDPRLLSYMESAVYEEALKHIDSTKYVVDNVEAIYVSKEFLEESAYNSKSNIFFGYTLDELDKHFQGTKYVFTLADDGKTIVKAFEPYDDTYDKIFLNVAIGTGVILVCVVVSVITYGAGAPAAAAIFAASAKYGAIAALSSAVIGGTAAGIATGIETGDFDESMKSAALAGSEGYKWGAITGALTGGAGEAAALHGATASGLTMNQVAQIQRESKYPLDVIKSLKTMEQYDILKKAGVTAKMLKGKTALVRNIDLNFVDEMGRTNLARMQSGLAPLDPTGTPYELHHIGQKVDSTLAILTRSEHRMGGNHAIWHEFTEATENPSSGAVWNITRKEFWEAFAKMVGG